MNYPAIFNPENRRPASPSSPVRAIGIDLGTTNSTIAEAVWDPARPLETRARCLEVEQETDSGAYTHLLVPSMVAVHGGRVLVGEGAKRLHARTSELGLEQNKHIFLESKNEMGTLRTFHRAPEGFKSPAEIGGKVLGFLKQAAEASGDIPFSRTVVTVPASFQLAQRRDTARAAELAGIQVGGGDLLDEPVAALFDFLVSHPGKMEVEHGRQRTAVVFDFGGGTCDVAVLRMERPRDGGLELSPLAVSRYHRLGGGDIDRAVLYEVLLPQILEQNGMGAREFNYETKKFVLEPTYISVAESLKVGLCQEIRRLQGFGKYREKDRPGVAKTLPGRYGCVLGGRPVHLQSPRLGALEFEKLLEPFLDRGLLYASETEYRLTCSVFAPLQDALDRAGLEPDGVDYCLMVGGSSLIPQVAAAVGDYFTKGELLAYEDPADAQTAVAKGAAYHSLALALYGRSAFRTVAQDPIALRTSSGRLELIPRRAALPYPEKGWARKAGLAVPATSVREPVGLKVEVIAGDEAAERPLMSARWDIPAPVNRGEGLSMEYRLDENQVLSFRIFTESDPGAASFSCVIENPLTNVVNPGEVRTRIQKAEEELRSGSVPKEAVPQKLADIARDYAELNQHERAVTYLERALRLKGSPDPTMLNLLGIYHCRLGDHQSEERCLRESAQHGRWAAPLFNLALCQWRRKLHKEALKTIDQAIERDNDGPSQTMRAALCKDMGDHKAGEASLKEAFRLFGAISGMEDWELGWYITACDMAGKGPELGKARDEQKRRKAGRGPVSDQGVLPELKGGLVRR
jgi:tetratricopeptide (TPR) repeat protein